MSYHQLYQQSIKNKEAFWANQASLLQWRRWRVKHE